LAFFVKSSGVVQGVNQRKRFGTLVHLNKPVWGELERGYKGVGHMGSGYFYCPKKISGGFWR